MYLFKIKNVLTKLLLASILVVNTAANADLPLTVEDLTAGKNRFKLNTNLSYFNQSYSDLNYQGLAYFRYTDMLEVDFSSIAISNEQ